MDDVYTIRNGTKSIRSVDRDNAIVTAKNLVKLATYGTVISIWNENLVRCEVLITDDANGLTVTDLVKPKPTAIVEVSGGLVQNVTTDGCNVVVRDYDVENEDRGHPEIKRNDSGEYYFESIYG